MRRTILTSLLACGLGAAGWSLPQDPSTAHGQVQIQTISPNFMQILQASPQAILNWNQFNIGLGETVRFLQPSTQAAILNRVTGLDPSLIQGTLQANGSVFLLNPNGILFGPNAVVDVGSFMASTLKMSDDDFLSGTYKLTQDRSLPLAAITNQGQIHVADGGFVVLTSPLLDNQGLIVAQSGTVHLGATTQATFSVDGRGQVQFAMPDGFNPQFTGGGQGGTVLLQPGQVSSILTQVVSNPGLVEAGSLSAGANGQTLAAGAEGVLINSGTIQADGGKVRLDSSQATVHTSAGVISARGGEARVLSDGTTLGLGSVDARGGFIEVSAQNLYQVGPLAAATVLIDPDNIQIVNDTNGNGTFDGMLGGLPANGNGTVSTGAIIATANLILTANNDISYVRTGSPDLIGTGTSLSLVAGHDIILDPGNANIELAALSLQANNQINITRAGLIKTYSGPISMTTTTGDILISSAGHLTLASPQTINIDAGNDFSLTLPAGFAFDESSTTMAITAGRNANIRADFVAQSVGNPLTLNAQGDVDLRSNTGSSLQWFLAGLDVQAGGSLTASSSGSLTLGTNPGDLNLVAAGGALSIQSPSTLALSSTQGTTLEGSSVLLDGGGINVQAQAGLTITSTNGNLHVTTSGGGSLVSSADAINMRSTGGEIRYTGPSNLDLRAAGSTDVNSATNLTIQTGNGFTLALDGTPTTLHADRTVDIRTTSITGGNHPVLMTAGENITFNPGPGSSLDFSQTQALTLTASRDLVFNVPNNFLVTTAGDQAFTAGRKLQATVGQTQQLISNTGKIGWQAGEISDDTGNSQDWRGPQGIRLVTSGGESGSSGNITLQDPNASIQLNSTGSDVNVTASHDITFSAASPVTLLSNVGSGTTTVNASNDVNITAGNGQSVTLGGTTARVKSGNDVFITTDGLRGDPAAGTALNLESAHDLSLRPQGTGAALQVQSASINATAVNDLLLDGGSNLFVTTTVGDLRLRGDRNLNLTTTGALQLISAGAMNLQGGNVTTNAGGNTLLQSATGTALTATTGNVSLVTGGTELRFTSTGPNTITAGGNVSLVEPQNLIMSGTSNSLRATNGNIDVGVGAASFSPSSFAATGALLLDAGGNVTFTGPTLSSADPINVNTQNGDVILQSLATGNLAVTAGGLNVTSARDLIARSNGGNVDLSTSGGADLKLAAGRNVTLLAPTGSVSVVGGNSNLSITGQNVTVQAQTPSSIRSTATAGKAVSVSATAGNVDLQLTGPGSSFNLAAPAGVSLSATGTLGIRSVGTGTTIAGGTGNVTLSGGIDSSGAILTISGAGLNILSSSTTNFAAGSVANLNSAGLNGNSSQDLDLTNLRFNLSGGNVTLNANRNLAVGTITFPATANATLTGGNITIQSMQNLRSGNITITTPGNLTEVTPASLPGTLPGLNITAGQIHNLNNTADNVSFSIPNTNSPATLNVTVTGGNDTVVPSAANLRNFAGANVQPVSIAGVTGDVYVDGMLRTAGQAPPPPPPVAPPAAQPGAPAAPPAQPTGLTAEERAQILVQSNLALGNLGSTSRGLSRAEVDHFTARMDSLHSPWNQDPISPTLALILPGGPPVVSAEEAAELAQMVGLDVAAAVNTMVAQEFGFIWEVRYWRNLIARLILWEDKE